VGYVLLDDRGKVVASSTQAIPSEAPSAPGLSIPYSASVRVAPGTYSLRLAARDDRGRLGRVDHSVHATLESAGTLELSDLLLGPAPAAGQPFRPSVRPHAESERLLAHGEIYSTDPAALEGLSVTIEVALADSDAAVRQLPVRLTKSPTPGRLLAQAVFDGTDLTPGRYVARLAVSVGQQPGMVTRRSFVVRPDAEEATSADPQ
jgi:hypothetical protein